jgi:hypothetical protein
MAGPAVTLPSPEPGCAGPAGDHPCITRHASGAAGLRDFLDDAGADSVARHRLAPWQRPSIATYARRHLQDPQAGSLMRLLDDDPNLMNLAGTPFYCEVLASEVRHGLEPTELRAAETETKLLALAVRRMIRREFENGLLQENWATAEDIESFIKDIAEENLRADGKGVRVDDVTELAPLSLSPDISEAEIDEAVQQIQQLPFFTGTIDLGRLSFSQEVVYDYLLGILATDYFSSNPKRFLHLLGVVPFSPDSVTVHVIREHVLALNGLDDLYREANSLIVTVFSEEEQTGDSCQHALELINRAAVTAAFPAEHPPRLHLCHGVLDGGTDLAEVRVEFPLPVFKFPAAEPLEWHDTDAVDSDVAKVCARVIRVQ